MQSGLPRYGMVLLIAAFSIPVLLAVTTIISPSILNQVAAWVLWGLSILALSKIRTPKLKNLTGLVPAYAFLLTLVVAICFSAFITAVPNERVWASLGSLFGASVIVYAGAAWRSSGHLKTISWLLSLGILLGALTNTGIGVIQILAPDEIGSIWIATSASTTRASGNLRQPNHMALLLLWGLVSLVILIELERIGTRFAMLIEFILCAGLALVASRTGYLGLLMLVFWAKIDSRLKKPSRYILAAAPILVIISWFGLSQWLVLNGQSLDTRLNPSLSGSARLQIWNDCLSMIQQNPWRGVGWGEFNFAWTLLPLPHRLPDYFDNAHNLIFHFAVELGLPVTILLCALLVWTAFKTVKSIKYSLNNESILISAIFAMLVLIFIHSLLEYPLWYTYFLFPTALFIGLSLATEQENSEQASQHNIFQITGGLVVALGGWFLLNDFGKAVQVTHPSDFEVVAPLAKRVAIGRESLIYSSSAELAWATRNRPGIDSIDATYKAAHGLLETNLMMIWISSLHEVGDYQRARYLAQRLREFNRADANAFLDKWEKSKASQFYFSVPPDLKMDFRGFRER